MTEVKITINAPEIEAAIKELIAAVKSSPKKETTQPTPTVSMAEKTTPDVPTTVPTAAPQYTLDMIAKAGTALIDEGKMEQLMQLLKKFEVSSLTELPPEKYGAVATELRALGAKI